MYKRYAVIVAGGVGRRMGGALPKQYLLLDGIPVLMHTIAKFSNCGNVEVVVVLHEEMQDYWRQLCKQYAFTKSHHIVSGGESRFQSVKCGVDFVLSNVDNVEECIVAIHDAARPLISTAMIQQAFLETAEKKATIVATISVNSVREGDKAQNKTKDRSKIWMVQTPQTFTADILQQAFLQKESPAFTDDAAVVEKLGYPIHIIEGDYRNIKITYPEDIAIAQLYMDAGKQNS